VQPDYRISSVATNGLTGQDLFWAVVEPMWEDLDFYREQETAADFFAKASLAQGAMIAMWWCRSEVCNGGFDQFFFNSTGMIWSEALKGFRMVGADSHAQRLEEALILFPGGEASRVRGERVEALESVPEEQRQEFFNPIDEAFFALERSENGNLDALCAKYIRSNPSEFFRD